MWMCCMLYACMLAGRRLEKLTYIRADSLLSHQPMDLRRHTELDTSQDVTVE